MWTAIGILIGLVVAVVAIGVILRLAFEDF